MPAKAVLFDLDGTLVDSLPLLKEVYLRVFEDLGLSWGRGDVIQWIGRPIVDIARHFAGGREKEFIDRYHHHYYREYDRRVRLFPGTAEMLRRLKEKGLALGIVTSKGRTSAWHTVRQMNLGEYMDVVVTAHDVERHKPLPDPVLKALEALAVGAAEAVYVGDSPYDVQAGKAAGVKTLGVTWGLSSAAELARWQPDGLIDSWDELEQFLAGF
ncbi:HAD family hydrolase [Desulfovirgula thermocuniculi]|uniref:HAD family hydrolase n=1 Tax=Desulfovirgula thermocuniculi TaxID=348842 RepID=UPI000412994C|nr:HAD-IA family hydrolase [Desulfovirgula thermocuniculi]